MKKKLFIIVSVLLVAAGSSSFAEATSFGLGPNLGSNTGLALRFGGNEFAVFTNLGLDLFALPDLGFNGEVGLDFQIADPQFGGGYHMPIRIGPMVAVRLASYRDWDYLWFRTGALFEANAEFQFPSVPIGIYLRLGAGAWVNLVRPDVDNYRDRWFDPAFSGAIGVLFYL